VRRLIYSFQTQQSAEHRPTRTTVYSTVQADNANKQKMLLKWKLMSWEWANVDVQRKVLLET